MTKKFFIIAGEPSGDLLGGKLIAQLKQQFKQKNEDVKFVGVGGLNMQNQGLQSIFAMSDLSVMGFFEILPHLPRLLKRIKQTADEIIKQQPDYIVTIDSPDFNFRVIKKIKCHEALILKDKTPYKIAKKIHMIAPSVWAYREKRAQKIAQLYDLLLAILPFEPPYFLKYNLKTVFIGHPIIENAPSLENKALIAQKFRDKYGFYQSDTVLYITPGSRVDEVKRIFGQFINAVNILKDKVDNLSVMIATVDKTRNLVTKMAKNLDVKYILLDQTQKNDALMSSNFALAKSGTNTLEASLYSLPMVVCYRANFLTYILAKILLRIKYANLINIVMDCEIIPELIQGKCRGAIIASRLEKIIKNKNIAQKQLQDSEAALKAMGFGSAKKATQKAVEEILNL